MLNRQEFYERILVAKAIAEVMKLSIIDAFSYVQTKEDAGTTDFVWLKIVGNQVTWGDHLLYVIAEILGLQIKQPGYEPFTVSEETLASDKEYAEWHANKWIPYFQSLLKKYANIYTPKLAMKMERGNKNWIALISNKYDICLESEDKLYIPNCNTPIDKQVFEEKLPSNMIQELSIEECLEKYIVLHDLQEDTLEEVMQSLLS